MIKWLIMFLLVCSPLYAAEVVCWDSSTDRISFYQKSANTPDFSSNPLCLIAPDLSGVSGVSRRHWIHDSAAIREMTQAEKDTLAQEKADARDVSIRASADRAFDGQGINDSSSPLALRAFADILKDEINILRALHSLAPRTLAQLKTSIKARISSGDVDE